MCLKFISARSYLASHNQFKGVHLSPKWASRRRSKWRHQIRWSEKCIWLCGTRQTLASSIFFWIRTILTRSLKSLPLEDTLGLGVNIWCTYPKFWFRTLRVGGGRELTAPVQSHGAYSRLSQNFPGFSLLGILDNQDILMSPSDYSRTLS